MIRLKPLGLSADSFWMVVKTPTVWPDHLFLEKRFISNFFVTHFLTDKKRGQGSVRNISEHVRVVCLTHLLFLLSAFCTPLPRFAFSIY